MGVPAASSVDSSAEAEFFSAQDVLLLLLFLGIVWLAGRLSSAARLPALVGELLVGALCGPPLGNWVPQPHALALLGQVGLVLLVVESVLEVEVSMLKQVGPRAIAIALFGSVLGPLPMAIGLGKAVGLSVTESLAVGASLSPTSMGVSVILFKQWRVLNTPTAQTIVSAAVLDDIIALVLLSELQALKHPSVGAFLIPIVSAVAFLLGVGACALFLVPPLLSRLLPRIPLEHVEVSVVLLLFLTVVGLMKALSAGRASYLLGCFLGGLSFSSLASLKGVWHHQVKRIQHWLLRVYFAATVGFVIPIRHLWTARVWALGLLFSLTTLGKLATGLLAPWPLRLSSVLTTGAAMAALGEFAFLVANTALHEGILTAETHAAVMLSIVLSIVVAPSCLRAVLAAQRRRADTQIAAASGAATRVYYRLAVRVAERWGLLPDVLRVLAAEGVDVLDCRVDTEGRLALLEAFLKDTRLVDDSPTTRGATGLDQRLAHLRAALLKLLEHDPRAVCAAGEDYEQPGQPPGDFTFLRGFSLTRWLPGAGPDEWAQAGRAENEQSTMTLMSKELSAPRATHPWLRARATEQLQPPFDTPPAAAASAAVAPISESDAEVGAVPADAEEAPLSDAARVDAVIAEAEAEAEDERYRRDEEATGLVGLVRRQGLSRTRSVRMSRVPSTRVLQHHADEEGRPSLHRGQRSARDQAAHPGFHQEFSAAVAAFRRAQAERTSL